MLPKLVAQLDVLEIAFAGAAVPLERLREIGWHVVDAHGVTRTHDSFIRYIDSSAGEFSVCKNVFAALNTGWFSDRSTVYLARGRPVILQDTGFSAHLPVGEGLFAVRTADEAASAIDAVLTRPTIHDHVSA